LGHTGVIDQHVNPPGPVSHALDGCLACPGIAHVATHANVIVTDGPRSAHSVALVKV